ncbi:inorganic polyphosphate kinase [Candidatus Nitromaritima sp. SCGC AAA799-A02]|nr:inorganic polyphosphate kinase [Candidatus Nitromaritima sp. SCGC AAA799-C22]KMP11992.1 inorganic polyphosphate kinase [Candidatus Nitromaritima sp. SCGC AAA799-A02]
MKNIGVFCKHKAPTGKEVLGQLTRWLRERDYKVFLDRDTATLIDETSSHQREDIPAQTDLLIVLGGDGTLLSVARISHPYDVPILGVNLGNLGFLAELSLNELYPVLEKVLAGKFDVEQRMLLNVCLSRNGAKVEDHNVLNDVIISKGAVARLINLQVRVDDQYMTSYRGDGLIIATPTGSTAYSLSAGGPIIHPSMHTLVLSPICPFTLTNRPILIPDQSIIQVRLATPNENVRITLDGQEGCDMKTDDILEIRKTKTTVKLIPAPGRNYYQILRQKLQWGTPHDEGTPDK